MEPVPMVAGIHIVSSGSYNILILIYILLLPLLFNILLLLFLDLLYITYNLIYYLLTLNLYFYFTLNSNPLLFSKL